MTETLDLFAAAAPAWLVCPGSQLERRFAEFHQDNPQVFAEFERRCLALAARGLRRVGSKAVWESMRFDSLIQTEGEPWRLNNSYTALMSRLLLWHHPELQGVIETRGHAAA